MLRFPAMQRLRRLHPRGFNFYLHSCNFSSVIWCQLLNPMMKFGGEFLGIDGVIKVISDRSIRCNKVYACGVIDAVIVLMFRLGCVFGLVSDGRVFFADLKVTGNQEDLPSGPTQSDQAGMDRSDVFCQFALRRTFEIKVNE